MSVISDLICDICCAVSHNTHVIDEGMPRSRFCGQDCLYNAKLADIDKIKRNVVEIRSVVFNKNKNFELGKLKDPQVVKVILKSKEFSIFSSIMECQDFRDVPDSQEFDDLIEKHEGEKAFLSKDPALNFAGIINMYQYVVRQTAECNPMIPLDLIACLNKLTNAIVRPASKKAPDENLDTKDNQIETKDDEAIDKSTSSHTSKSKQLSISSSSFQIPLQSNPTQAQPKKIGKSQSKKEPSHQQEASLTSTERLIKNICHLYQDLLSFLSSDGDDGIYVEATVKSHTLLTAYVYQSRCSIGHVFVPAVDTAKVAVKISDSTTVVCKYQVNSVMAATATFKSCYMFVKSAINLDFIFADIATGQPLPLNTPLVEYKDTDGSM